MQEVLEYIKHVEGDIVHRNKGEKDITAPYGIYRYVHPTAGIFKYIDSIAMELGLNSDSSKWGDSDIAKINKKLDQHEVEEYANAFYEEFFKDARLHLFDKNSKILCVVLFTNSPVMMWKSVQLALQTLQEQDRIDSELQLSKVDGMFGSKTNNALLHESVKKLKPFELYDNIMIAAQYQYVSLWHKNKPKYGVFLYGWFNRLKSVFNW